MKAHSLYNFIMFRLLIAGCFLLVSYTVFSQQTLRTNLFVVSANGSKILIDGNITIYDDVYCNCVDYEDGWKLTNPGENWGLLRTGITLVVERRKVIPENDTTYIRMWNLQQRNFTMQVIARNLAQTDRVGFVKDNYTNLLTPINLSDTTYINFSVNSNSGTSAQNRFSVIFEKFVQSPIPVSFTSIKLLRKDALVSVEFAVENELLVTNYMLQQAGDTINFKNVKSVAPRNRGGSEFYNEDAGDCGKGDNFYRVKATSANGKITYSSVAKLALPAAVLSMSVYPNPTTSKQLHLQIGMAPEGKYQVMAIGINGAVYPLGSMQLTGVQSTLPLTLPASIKPGVYRIQLIGPGNTMIVKSVTIL